MIQYQILQTNITWTVWQTVRRITNEILEVKGLSTGVCVIESCFLFTQWKSALKTKAYRSYLCICIMSSIEVFHPLTWMGCLTSCQLILWYFVISPHIFWKYLLVLLLPEGDQGPWLYPFTPKSDKHIISPYTTTLESHIMVMSMKEMITN